MKWAEDQKNQQKVINQSQFQYFVSIVIEVAVSCLFFAIRKKNKELYALQGKILKIFPDL